MKANKIILDGETLIDLTTDTVTESDVANGKTFHKANGERAVGTFSLSINGIIKQYKVEAGENISTGDFVEFITKFGGGTLAISPIYAFDLGNNRLVLFTNSKVSILKVSGSDVIVESSKDLETIHRDHIVSATLTEGNVVFILSGLPDNTSDLRVGAIQINGNEIVEYNSIIAYADLDWVWADVMSVDEGKALIAYKYYSESEYNLCCRVVEFKNESISVGSMECVNTSEYTDAYITVLNPSTAISFIQTAQNTTSKVFRRCAVITINGTSIVYSTVTFSDIYNINQALALSSDLCVVKTSISVISVQVTKNLSTYSVTTQASQSIEIPENCEMLNAYKLSESKIVIFFRHKTFQTLHATVYGVSKAIISEGTATNIVTVSASINSVSALDGNTAVVFYEDINGGTSRYATLTVDNTNISADSTQSGIYVKKATTKSHYVGVANTSGVGGETVDVYEVETKE